MAKSIPTPKPRKSQFARVQLNSVAMPPPVRWILIFRSNALELTRDRPFVIGRSPRCDIVIGAAIVSRAHCRVSVTLSGVRVEDLHSENGVFVNGERVDGARDLLVGDRLTIGNETVVLCTFGAASVAEEKSRRATVPELDVEQGGPSSSTRTAPSQDEAESPTDRREAFDTLGSLADRMLATGRLDTAEKILTGHIFAVLGGKQGFEQVEDKVIESSSRYALKLAAARLEGAWVDLVIEYHSALRRPLSDEAIEEVRALLAHRVEIDSVVLSRYKDVLRTAVRQGALEETDRIRMILGLESAL